MRDVGIPEWSSFSTGEGTIFGLLPFVLDPACLVFIVNIGRDRLLERR